MMTRFPYKSHGKWFVESWTNGKEVHSVKIYKCFLRAIIEYSKRTRQ